jgi:transcriptional regulator with GAF, ATPase, and Fis domain
MVDRHAIGRLLLETGRISNEDYSTAIRESKKTGKSLHEILLFGGKISVDELFQALTIHMDITLLRESLGIEKDSSSPRSSWRPLGSYLERISLLFKMGTVMSEETNVGALLDLLVREAPTVMNAERATIFLADYESEELYSHTGVGLRHDQIRIPWDSGIAGWVFTHEESLNIVDTYNDPRFNREVDPRTGFTTKNLLCVPLRSPGGPVIGVFQVLNKRAGVFIPTDEEILEILASQAARSISQAMEWSRLREKASLLKQENLTLKRQLRHADPLGDIVGNTWSMRDVRGLIEKVAPTDATVLIQGESGTGKELVARAVHKLSPRAEQPFICLNCAAVPAELIESELFGHKRGAFTGAVEDRKGVFRAAHTGTLFLDEIEATSPSMQVKLLRALQVGEIKPVGDNNVQQVDVRLVAATNTDLDASAQQGHFREDLFYRINVFPIMLPPLRDRVEDIPNLVRHFLDKFTVQTGKVVRGIDPVAMELLNRYSWPGNVRELENEIERAHILCAEGSSLSVRCLSPRITSAAERADKPPVESVTLKDAVEELEEKMIRETLKSLGGNRTLTARKLGLSRQGLINKIYKFEIEG